jgi:Rrf2 family iron-sulfur cluster assembly transcriptional regulator
VLLARSSRPAERGLNRPPRQQSIDPVCGRHQDAADFNRGCGSSLSLSQTAGYAILALCHLDPERERLVLARDIAERTGIPKAYLSKMLNQLQHAGLVTGKRGYRGGLKLVRPADQITLYEVVVAIDGEGWRQQCVLGLPGCGCGEPCPMHEFWGEERSRIEERLRAMNLAQIRDFQERGWRL